MTGWMGAETLAIKLHVTDANKETNDKTHENPLQHRGSDSTIC